MPLNVSTYTKIKFLKENSEFLLHFLKKRLRFLQLNFNKTISVNSYCYNIFKKCVFISKYLK